MDPRRLYYLHAMGIQPWIGRDRTAPAPVPAGTAVPATPAAAPAPGAALPDAGDVAALDWAALERRVAACTACDLHRGRTQTVFGVGNRQADWMLIGEAPGAEEDRRGEPFVGRAGQLLNAMLQAAGFARRDVYIANIVKCRPPQNRDPRPAEAAACSAYLARQIALVQPKLILTVGRVAAQSLLHTDQPVGRLRGRVHRYEGERSVPVVVTYHPAYLLRTPSAKSKAWSDLLRALELTA